MITLNKKKVLNEAKISKVFSHFMKVRAQKNSSKRETMVEKNIANTVIQ